MNVNYVSGNLLDAPHQGILVHACNCYGVWGGGIAKVLRYAYPDAYARCRVHCERYGASLLGTSKIFAGGEHDIGCLFTSKAYGQFRDSPEEILDATSKALDYFLETLEREGITSPVYSNKFNSGLFGVPWEDTEAVLKSKNNPLTWTVYVLET